MKKFSKLLPQFEQSLRPNRKRRFVHLKSQSQKRKKKNCFLQNQVQNMICFYIQNKKLKNVRTEHPFAKSVFFYASFTSKAKKNENIGKS